MGEDAGYGGLASRYPFPTNKNRFTVRNDRMLQLTVHHKITLKYADGALHSLQRPSISNCFRRITLLTLSYTGLHGDQGLRL